MAEEGEDPGLYAGRRRRRFRRRQRHHPALQLRIAPAPGGARERLSARRSRQEPGRAHHHRFRSGDQPDPARAVARSGAQGHPGGEPDRQSGIRFRLGPARRAQSVRRRPRPQHHVAGRARAGILLRAAQCFGGREVARHRRRFLLGQSRSRRARGQPHRRDLSRDAADGQAGPDPRRRLLAGCRDRQDAHESGRGRSQGRAISFPDQSVRRLQQHLAAEPAAHRNQLADRGGARTEGGSGGEGAPIARSHPLRQIDRFLRQRQFRHDAAPDRAAYRVAQPVGRAIDHAARPASAHQGTQGADCRGRRRDPGGRRAAGAPARQRRQGRRRPPADADREPRPGQETRLAVQRAGRRAARARARGQDPARSAGILSGKIPRSLRPRQHQCRAAGGAHHFARLARHQAVFSEETADRADRGLCRIHAVGGLHGHRRAAGAAGRRRLRLCAGELWRWLRTAADGAADAAACRRRPWRP